jgi:putative addiction module component (TIGR02574 family)
MLLAASQSNPPAEVAISGLKQRYADRHIPFLILLPSTGWRYSTKQEETISHDSKIGRTNMNRELEEIFREALKLPPEARAALAGSLLESLEEEVDEVIEESWCMELKRRLSELDSGKAKVIPWSEARRRILED